uniref:Uncharacterized protein n=1 Tax=Plectus sambesii TaxID=2011161 RepID=A0A914WR66_9BILA
MSASTSRRSAGFVLSDNETYDSDAAIPRSIVFSARVEAAAKACNEGDFEAALLLYNDVVRIDPTNNVLYSNRSAILCKLGRFADALDDAHQAQTLKPGWAKVGVVFLRVGLGGGVALQPSESRASSSSSWMDGSGQMFATGVVTRRIRHFSVSLRRHSLATKTGVKQSVVASVRQQWTTVDPR